MVRGEGNVVAGVVVLGRDFQDERELQEVVDEGYDVSPALDR